MDSIRNPFLVSSADVSADPYPYLFTRKFVDPSLYQELKKEWPSSEVWEKVARQNKMADPYSHGGALYLFRDTEVFNDFLATSKVWANFYSFLNSKECVEWVVSLFAPYLETYGAAVNPKKVGFMDYCETRPLSLLDRALYRSKTMGLYKKLHEALHQGQLYIDFSFSRANPGFEREAHIDNRNKLAGALLYFCKQEDLPQGGDYIFYKPKQKDPSKPHERFPKKESLIEARRIKPDENSGLIVLHTPDSYHGVSRFEASTGFRDNININICTLKPVWPN